ncbi:MAG: protoheme IX farnesyltransferase, partial [Alphaproteobacteria bacterium]|nr:protoheme IX farnesyltransferase [Alphaproteobacteria bacterium]
MAQTMVTSPHMADPADFIALMKPRVMSLVVFTTVIGMMLAPTAPHPLLMVIAILAIAAGAGASGAINQWYDRDIDAVMKRTQSRPIPAGKINPDEALAFGVIISMLSVLVLWFAANVMAAALLAFTIFFYAVVYSVWLKRSTPQNIVIGGAAGAFPPAIGWLAAGGSLTLEPLILFGIIFIWTPPHFWALALVKNDDYTRAGIPMMPVVAG